MENFRSEYSSSSIAGSSAISGFVKECKDCNLVLTVKLNGQTMMGRLCWAETFATKKLMV